MVSLKDERDDRLALSAHLLKCLSIRRTFLRRSELPLHRRRIAFTAADLATVDAVADCCVDRLPALPNIQKVEQHNEQLCVVRDGAR